MFTSPFFGTERIYRIGHILRDVSSAVWRAWGLQLAVPMRCPQECGFILGHSPSPAQPLSIGRPVSSRETAATSGPWCDQWPLARGTGPPPPASTFHKGRAAVGRPFTSLRLVAEGKRRYLGWLPQVEGRALLTDACEALLESDSFVCTFVHSLLLCS